MLYNALIGLLAGWIVNKFYRKIEASLWQNLVLGVVGSVLGGFLASLAGFDYDKNLIPSLIVACGGAVLAIWLKNKLTNNT